MDDVLTFRRQFLLAREAIGIVDWHSTRIGDWFLYTHPDLQVTISRDPSARCILLGYLYDTERIDDTNQQILDRISATSADFDALVAALKSYVGRYALVFRSETCLRIIQDALALREVYYVTSPNRVICGSQPRLLARYANPPLVKSSDPAVVRFVTMHMPHVRKGRLWPGDGTPYEAVRHLLPNHSLDLTRMIASRYWPTRALVQLDYKTALSRCTRFLQGALAAAAKRHKLMMAVTAGFDSRALLAASRPISTSVYYFINKIDRIGDSSPDLVVPAALLRRLGLEFHVHEYSRQVPESFRRSFFDSVDLADDELLPVIYNVYHANHSEKLNVLGVGEVGRTKFYDEPRRVSAFYLAYMLRYRRSRFAVDQCDAWLKASQPVARRCGVNVMTLFWWEVLIGNWGAVGNSESDLAIEEFDPFASHYIYETFLRIHARYRTFHNNLLFRDLVTAMWPDAMSLPVNPPETLGDRWRGLLAGIGVEYPVRRLKSLVMEAAYHAFWKRT